mmetsp:Transcript_12549/g.33074  ORF Transcript_12549/g.33074 Transcript_12549/m.33074 type:complete len:280 (+) Transcript_12549:784-1623(+)
MMSPDAKNLSALLFSQVGSASSMVRPSFPTKFCPNNILFLCRCWRCFWTQAFSSLSFDSRMGVGKTRGVWFTFTTRFVGRTVGSCLGGTGGGTFSSSSSSMSSFAIMSSRSNPASVTSCTPVAAACFSAAFSFRRFSLSASSFSCASLICTSRNLAYMSSSAIFFSVSFLSSTVVLSVSSKAICFLRASRSISCLRSLARSASACSFFVRRSLASALRLSTSGFDSDPFSITRAPHNPVVFFSSVSVSALSLTRALTPSSSISCTKSSSMRRGAYEIFT